MNKTRLAVLLTTLAVCAQVARAQINPVITNVATQPSPPLAGVAFALTVNGLNFCATSIIVFDNQALVTTPSSVGGGIQLDATVAANLTAGLPPNHLVQVASPLACSPNSGVSNGVQLNTYPPLNVTLNFPSGDVGVSYTGGVSATGGQQPLSYTTPGTAQPPPGLTLNAINGLLTGTPTQAGTFNFQVTVGSADGQNVVKDASITIRPLLQITTSTLPSGTVQQFYTTTLAGTGGLAPYTWSLLGGAPPGFGVSTSGVLSGTPLQTGTFNVNVKLTDQDSLSVSKILVLQIGSGVQITTTTIPGATAGTPYNVTLTATGGLQPYTWSTSSTLPAGINLSPGGVLAGTTQQIGTFPLVVGVLDSFGLSAQANLSLVVVAPLTIQTASLPAGAVNVSYNAVFAAAGGTAPYTWTTNSTLPTGINLAPDGTLSGLTQQSGTFPLTVVVTDSNLRTTQGVFSLVIASALVIQTAALPPATTGSFYTFAFLATGGRGPTSYSWSSSAALPPGLALSAAGVLSGIPTQAGSFQVNAIVNDGLQTANKSLTLSVANPLQITTSSLPAATSGLAYSTTFAATGGTVPYTWTTNSTLPSGITLAPNGTLAGLTPQSGTFPLTVVVTDSNQRSVQGAFSLVIASALVIQTAALPAATTGTFYSFALTATGGNGPTSYSWSSSAALPPGLALSAAGVLSGTPTQAGSFQVSASVTDGLQTANKSLTLSVANPLQITTTSLPVAPTGGAYSTLFSATGGTSPYTWTTNSPLPSGITLAPNGTLAGLTQQSGSFVLTVTVRDSNQRTAQGDFTLVVSNALVITTGALPPGTTGAFYTFTFTATGGLNPSFWSTSSPLPPGLALSSAGVLSGTPTQAGTFSVSVTVSDDRQSASGSFPLAIATPLKITTTTLPSGTTGVLYTTTLAATGGTLPYSWSTASALPPGIALSAGGVLSGTTQQTGSFPLVVVVRDSNGRTDQAPLTLVITNPLQITTLTLPVAPLATLYTTTFAASGGLIPYTWSILEGAPAGFTLNPVLGTLTGTPQVSATYTFTAVVRDSLNQTASRVLTLVTGNSLNITANLPQGDVGIPYSAQLSANGGVPPITFSISGALPPGLAFSASNASIGGTPTQGGTYDLTISVRSADGQTASTPASITIRPPLRLQQSSLPSGIVNQPYSTTVTASGGLAPYTWTPVSGVPPGLTFAQSGVLSGTPTVAGDYSVTVRLSDRNGSQVTQSLPLQIRATVQPLLITTTSLPVGTPGVLYTAALTATGGTQPYNWSTSSALPTGITLSASGVLSGTTQQSGTFPLTVRVLDSAGLNAQANLSLVISAALRIQTTSLPAGVPNTSYSTTFAAAGGTPAYNWSTTSTLPSGISLSSNGVLAGLPTQSGSFPLLVVVTDSTGQTAQGNFTLVITGALSIQTSSLPAGTPGSYYAVTLIASGGTGNYTWSSSLALPFGFTLSSAGLLSGVPQQSGSGTVSVTVSDGQQSVSASFILTINSTVQITTTSLPVVTLNVFYSATIVASGGAAPYAWSILDTAPPGFTLDPSTGILSGTAFVNATYTFTVQVRDSAGQSATRALTLVAGNAINILTNSLKTGSVGLAYLDTFTGSGGNLPYQWQIVEGSVPGLSLDFVTGNLSGTPALPGIFNLTVRVTDTLGQNATRSYSVVINPSFKITVDSLPPATVGVFYQVTITATGGSTPYTWGLTGSPLPGISLNSSTGVLSGFPTQAGTFQFTVLATDISGLQTSKQYTLTSSQTILISPDSLPGATLNVPYSQTLTAAGGNLPYTFILLSGGIPGVTLNASGLLSGTPTQAGTFQFNVRVTDLFGQQGARSYTLTVTPNLTLGPGSLPDGVTGIQYVANLAASGGTPPYTWRVVTGALPDGLNLSASGSISGTPLSAGVFSFTAEATDSTALKATLTYTITVASGVKIQQTALPPGTAGAGYSANLTATGGTSPYQWRVSQGSLPDGLLLNPANGVIAGTASLAGRFSFTIEASDAVGRKATADFTIIISAPLLRITSTDTLPAATVGTDFMFTPAAAGGTPPYRWALTGAPAELTINATTGVIQGRPASAGTLSFTIRVTDNAQVSATQTVSLRVALPPNPDAMFTGVTATGGANQQLSPRVSLTQPYALPLTGDLTLTFTPTSGPNDPAVQFSSGGRRVTFTIAAGETAAVFATQNLGLQTGTVAGVISLTVRYAQGAIDVTPTPAPSTRIQIPNSAPVISALQANRTATGFDLVITAYSTTREITSASIRLTTSGSISASDFTVNLSQALNAWYQSAASAPFGSLMKLTIPFTVQGTSGSVTGASVTLTNSVGTSPASTVSF